eukprot:Nk52_evm10s16 gene=Nk52_evmTU10s16
MLLDEPPRPTEGMRIPNSSTFNYGEDLGDLVKRYREQFGKSWLVVYNEHMKLAENMSGMRKGLAAANAATERKEKYGDISGLSSHQQPKICAQESEDSELDDYVDTPNTPSVEIDGDLKQKYESLESPASCKKKHKRKKRQSTPRRRRSTNIVEFEAEGLQKSLGRPQRQIVLSSGEEYSPLRCLGEILDNHANMNIGKECGVVKKPDEMGSFVTNYTLSSGKMSSTPVDMGYLEMKCGDNENDIAVSDKENMPPGACKTKVAFAAESGEGMLAKEVVEGSDIESDKENVDPSSEEKHSKSVSIDLVEDAKSDSFHDLILGLNNVEMAKSAPFNPCVFGESSAEESLKEPYDEQIEPTPITPPLSSKSTRASSPNSSKLNHNSQTSGTKSEADCVLPKPEMPILPKELEAELTSQYLKPDNNLLLHFVLKFFGDGEKYVFFCKTRYFSKNRPYIEKTSHILLSNLNLYFINFTDGIDFDDMVKVEFRYPLSKISSLAFGIFYQSFTLQFQPSRIVTIMTRDEDLTQRFVDDLMVCLQALLIHPKIIDEEDSTLDNFDSTVRSSEEHVDLSDVQSYLNCFRIACEQKESESVLEGNDGEPDEQKSVSGKDSGGYSFVSSSLSFDYPDMDWGSQPMHKAGPLLMQSSMLRITYWKSYHVKLMGSSLCFFGSKGDEKAKVVMKLGETSLTVSEVENPSVPFVFEICTRAKKVLFAAKSKADYEQWKLLLGVIGSENSGRYVTHQSTVIFEGRRGWLLLYSDMIVLANTHNSLGKCVVSCMIPISCAVIKMSSKQKRLAIEYCSKSVEVEFPTTEEKGICMARISQAKSLELHEETKFGGSAFEIETEIEHVSATLNNLRAQCSDSNLHSEARERLKKQITFFTQKIEALHMQYFNEMEQNKLNTSLGSPTPASVNSFMSRSLQLFKKPTEANYRVKDNVMYCSVIMTHDCLYLCNEDHRWRLKLDFDHTYERLSVRRIQDVDEVYLQNSSPPVVTVVFSSKGTRCYSKNSLGFRGEYDHSGGASGISTTGFGLSDKWALVIPCEHERLKFLACLKNAWKAIFKVDLTIVTYE